jgi:MYXO-CTERM domain-containing protein
VNSGRDIAFDAADNIYYVSSGQATFRILSPGGVTATTLSYNGTSFSFSNAVPEPGALAAASLSLLPLLQRRRKRTPMSSG